MKQHWQKIIIILTFVITVINFVCIINLYDMTENKISNLRHTVDNRISNVENSIGDISRNVKNAIEEGNSIIASYSYETIEVDSETGIAEISFSVLPKEYTSETKVSVRINEKPYETEFKNGSYCFETEIPMFETLSIADITITDGNINKNEKIDFYLSPGEEYKAYVYGGYSGQYGPVVKDKKSSFALNGIINIDVNLNSREPKLKDTWTAYFVSDGKTVKTLESEFRDKQDYYAYGELEINETFEIDKDKDFILYVVAQDTYGFYHVTQTSTFYPGGVIDHREIYEIYSKDGKLLYSEEYY